MSTPRTPDDGRNERQRQQQEEDTRPKRAPDDGQRDKRPGEKNQPPTDDERRAKGHGNGDRRQLLEDRPPDYIERTKPEDRLDDTSRHGQQTRDNVNPAIPSAPPGEGGIVDPRSLGMESTAGVAPPAVPTQQQLTDEQKQALADHMPSINEPLGSNVESGDAGPVELPPLVLSDIDPDSVQLGTMTDFTLTVTGSGFTPQSVIVFDDEELPTTFVSPTQMTANPPSPAEAATVDVEVTRGDEMSDVLTFDFVAAGGTRGARKAPERKPKKETPAAKRTKKGKRG